ncbi:MAG: hypothetical protein K0R57_5659 [Paenibacillaceae bacterium]|jgi:hypothetical protein|nr:hypothetical protein [Paenibacillaceae bacterium]
MKKPLLNIVLFLGPVFLFFGLNLLFHGDQKVSALEQRAIQQMPDFTLQSIVENTFTKDFDKYFSDNFVFRTSFLEAGGWLKGLKGAVGNEVTLVERSGGNNMSQNLGGNTPDGAAVDPNAASADGNETKVDVQQTASETYLIVKDQAMSLYQFYPESAAVYADAINRLQAAVDSRIHVYSMLAPSSVEFLNADKYKEMSSSQKEAFDYVAERYNGHIKPVPVYNKLNQHKTEYIFYRTDHHWTSLGAYYAYQALMETMGLEPVTLNKYESVRIESFLGSAYGATLNNALKKNPDTITVYKPLVAYENQVYWNDSTPVERDLVELELPADGRSGYAVFMGGDYPLDIIKTKNSSGKRLLVIKDSYGNALIPFLLPHFEEIVVVDPRYYKESLVKLTQTEKITDILTINSSIVTTYTGIADLIVSLLK